MIGELNHVAIVVPDLDKAVKLMTPLEKFLRQDIGESISQAEAFERLSKIVV